MKSRTGHLPTTFLQPRLTVFSFITPIRPNALLHFLQTGWAGFLTASTSIAFISPQKNTETPEPQVSLETSLFQR